ncbi:hypothetical protein [Massilia scottii]|uniref:hypothetical protein n=1 Tax=Massilia scottii TaxID=3057166 RepID=UPI002796D22A|nr:hypothetical protein [Massilia sp. CCM 9029]MDQ1835217.1 hypothetical protein [Massilia sp. CCM 9029]
MVTAIGNSTPQTIASWVAEARRTRRILVNGFADPFTIADCNTVTSNLAGLDRLEAMLASAVAEALDGAFEVDPIESAECLEILVAPVWLDNQACNQLNELLTTWICPYTAWSNKPRTRLVVKAGSTGCWMALEHAYQALLSNPALNHVLIAAVDSQCEPTVLQAAASEGFLLRKGNAQGYVAGEAAGCLILQRANDINDVPAGGFALHRPALVKAPLRLWPGNEYADPTPLTQVLFGALQACAMDAIHISHLESDMDGSEWRAQLESTALDRVIFNKTTALPQWRPATLFGQPGNASGIIYWLLLTMLHQNQIERINTVLNWSIEPSGEIAACVLERSPH